MSHTLLRNQCAGRTEGEFSSANQHWSTEWSTILCGLQHCCPHVGAFLFFFIFRIYLLSNMTCCYSFGKPCALNQVCLSLTYKRPHGVDIGYPRKLHGLGLTYDYLRTKQPEAGAACRGTDWPLAASNLCSEPGLRQPASPIGRSTQDATTVELSLSLCESLQKTFAESLQTFFPVESFQALLQWRPNRV